MGVEIERKFLVPGDWPRERTSRSERIEQGYLASEPERSVRVRIAGDAAVLTLKGRQRGRRRPEFEYPLPVADAREILDALCLRPLIEKTRHRLRHGDHDWVVDEFAGDNAGLVVAEIELDGEDEAFAMPPWVGAEVTDDPRYLNANLVRRPFRAWSARDDDADA